MSSKRTTGLLDVPRLAAQLFERGSDLFATTDDQGRLTTLNPAWEEILGWRLDEVEGKRFSELVHPDEAANIRAFAVQRRTAGRTLVGIESRARHKDGGYRWINWSATSDGLHWYAIGRDVTARKQAEERAQLFASLVEVSDDFIAVAALDQSILFVNAAGRRLVGLSSLEEARSKKITEFLTPEGVRASLEVEQPAVIAHGSWRGESTLRHFTTGEAIAVEINSFLVTDPETGAPRALATVQRDIRERRAAEAQLARLADERGRLAILALHQTETERARISEALHDEVMQTLLVARQDLEEALSGDEAAGPRAAAALQRATGDLRALIRGAHPQA
ncbi:MAG: PAS domain S-box protein, partial [Solirubrobacteraceae bacterium]